MNNAAASVFVIKCPVAANDSARVIARVRQCSMSAFKLMRPPVAMVLPTDETRTTTERTNLVKAGRQVRYARGGGYTAAIASNDR